MTITSPSRTDERASDPLDDAPPRVGRNELGSITFADSVVEKIASRAAVEIPDAGGAAPRLLGRTLPDAASLGTRKTGLHTLPKATAQVDGSMAVINLAISVRWPASVPHTAAAVRDHVRERVAALTGLTVPDVTITVTDLVTHLAPVPRVQ